jgi:hypothetical protein
MKKVVQPKMPQQERAGGSQRKLHKRLAALRRAAPKS